MAYVTIPQLSTGTALNGLEQFEAVQSSNSVKLTATQIKTFVSSNPSFTIIDAGISNIANAASFVHETSADPATITAGFGVGLSFIAELNTNGNFTGAKINTIAEDVTAGAESVGLSILTAHNGGAPETRIYVGGDGKIIFTPESGLTNNILVEAGGADNAVVFPITLDHVTAGNTASTGIGTGLKFDCTLSGTASPSSGVAQINAIGTDLSSPAASKFDLAINLMRNLTVSEVARFTNDRRLGIGTSTPSSTLEAVIDDINSSSSVSAARFTHTTSSTPTVGIGVGVELATETPDGIKIGGTIFTTSTDVTVGSEDFILSFATMSGGATATEKLRVGDVVYTPSPFGTGVVPATTSWLSVGAGTTTISSAKLTAGSLLTTATAGSLEYNGYGLFYTPQSTQRGVIPAQQYYQLGSDLSRDGTITTTQSLFGVGVAVSATTRYAYEISATITATAATSKAVQFAIGGTAILSAHEYDVVSDYAAASATVATASIMSNRITSGFSTLVTITPAGAAGAFTIKIKGVIDVLSGGAGTVNFQFALTAAGTSVSVVAGSNVAIWPLNTITSITDNTQIGAWS
jgi:hypothetical protein